MFAVLAAASAAAQSTAWITFSNQSTTRLPTDSGFTTDPDEKDLVVVDIDHDGDDDVFDFQKNDVYSNASPRTHRLLLNVGGVMVDASATYAPDFATRPSIARLGIVADFTGDGWEDVVVVNTNDFGVGSLTQNQLQFYRNLGNNASGQWLGLIYDTTGRFPQYTTPYARFCGGAAADFDQDGDQDLYLGDYNNNLEDRLLYNDGAGFFTDVTASRIPGGSSSNFTVEVQVGDFNMDGWPDIALSDPGTVRVRVNNGAGYFLTTTQPPAPGTYTLAVGDLNNDGKDDIYQGRDGQDGYNLNLTTVVGAPNILFSDVTLTNSPGTGAFAGNAYVVDMDNDGWKDVVMGDIDVDVPGCDRHATLLRNTPGAGIILSDPWGAGLPCGSGCQPWHTSGTHDIAVLDINGDGLKDMIYAKCVGYACWIQTTPPMQLSLSENQPGSLEIAVSFAPPNGLLYNFASLIQLPLGASGPFFGLDSSALQIFVALYPHAPSVGVASPSGAYSFSLPAGTFPQNVAWTWQMRTIAPTATGLNLSNIVTKTF